MPYHQQESIDRKQHRCKHKQDMRHQNRSRHIIPESDQQRLLGRISLAIDGDIILQFAGNWLDGQNCLPGTVFPREIHRGIGILCRETTVMQLYNGIFRQILQGHDLILLHPTPRQFLCITLPIQFNGHPFGMRRPRHTLIDTQRQRDDNR